MTKRIVYYLMVLLLFGMLAGCNRADDTTTSEGGKLYLNTSSVISVTYDAQGKVTAITAESDNAKEIVKNFKDFENKDCADVLVELVEKVGEAGHLEDDSIKITFDENVSLPEAGFEENIQQQIQDTLTENEWEATVKVEAPEITVNTNPNGTNSEKNTEKGTEETVKLPEGSVLQEDGTYIYNAYLDSANKITDSAEKALYYCTYIYSADGYLISEYNIWRESEIPRFYIEYFPNGNTKVHKKWNGYGVLSHEFTAFHDKNAQNGISVEYNTDTGEVKFRTTEGNPDGSPATSEQWTEENGGEYIVFIYDSSYITEFGPDGEIVKEATLVEERYTLDSGAYHYHTYDYSKNTMHTIGYWPETNSKRDMITTITTDLPVEGYTESTIDGIYRREEWKNKKKVSLISDGGNYMGYKVKDTTYYHSNGQVKSFERYFYADGGRYYIEYDEQGNETFSEITTKYY